MEIQQVEIKYLFSEEEITQIGRDIARLSQDIQVQEDEKKAVMSEFKHKIDEIKKKFNENINRVNNGFEMRNVEARMSKNYFTNEREYYDPITGDLVKREPFKPGDLQRNLLEDVDDVTAFERKSKAPKAEEVLNENGEPEAVKTEEQPEGYERLEYNEVLQKFHVDDVRFSRAGREQNEDWKIIAEKRADIITNFLWLFPEFRGSFADAKNEFENYLIRLEETEALKEAAEATTEEQNEGTEGEGTTEGTTEGEETTEGTEGETTEGTEGQQPAEEPAQKKRVRKKYIVKSKRTDNQS